MLLQSGEMIRSPARLEASGPASHRQDGGARIQGARPASETRIAEHEQCAGRPLHALIPDAELDTAGQDDVQLLLTAG